MFVDFLNLKFKNILSYGNNLTVVDFSSGLNQIIGMNGQGKSSILDALSFGLFGQPYRKIKLEELINRKNKGNLYTEVEFIANGDTYKIERGIKPKILKIWKNNVEQDELPSTARVQAEINNILAIDYTLFKEVICLAVNYNKPFLLLPKNDKRNLFENIFQISIVSKILAEIKNRQKGIDVDYKLSRTSYNATESEIENLEKYIEKLKSIEKNFNDEKEKKLNAIQKNIDECEKQLVKCCKGRDKGKAIIENLEFLDLKLLIEERHNLSSDIIVDNMKIKNNKEAISLLNDNDNCPNCKSHLTESHKKNHINTYQSEIIEFQDNIKDLESKLIDNKSLIDDENKKKDQLTKVEKVFIKIDADENNYKDKLKSLKEAYTKEACAVYDIDIDSLLGDAEGKKVILETLDTNNKKLLKDIEINNKSIEVLSDNGIKSYLYKKFLPNLNVKINEYLNLFSLPVSLKFDETMVENIQNIINKKQISYGTFSAGEQKRIDLSVMFSFIQIMKDIANWRCNILFLDEVLDSSTDHEGLVQILESLQNLVDKNSNLCVYVISHRLHSKDFFSKKLRIEKSNGFSLIREET
jgi:DNA repair exonuclease SbcCD ATPase subunit